MKYLITISLLFFAFLVNAQEKQDNVIEIIPTFSSSYYFGQIRFHQDLRKAVVPNVNLGIAIKDSRWFSAIQVGVLHPAIELKIGVVAFKIKNKRPHGVTF